MLYHGIRCLVHPSVREYHRLDGFGRHNPNIFASRLLLVGVLDSIQAVQKQRVIVNFRFDDHPPPAIASSSDPKQSDYIRLHLAPVGFFIWTERNLGRLRS